MPRNDEILLRDDEVVLEDRRVLSPLVEFRGRYYVGRIDQSSTAIIVMSGERLDLVVSKGYVVAFHAAAVIADGEGSIMFEVGLRCASASTVAWFIVDHAITYSSCASTSTRVCESSTDRVVAWNAGHCHQLGPDQQRSDTLDWKADPAN